MVHPACGVIVTAKTYSPNATILFISAVVNISILFEPAALDI